MVLISTLEELEISRLSSSLVSPLRPENVRNLGLLNHKFEISFANSVRVSFEFSSDFIRVRSDFILVSVGPSSH